MMHIQRDERGEVIGLLQRPLTTEEASSGDWLEADPAVASSVFVTMITDSMGFLIFLGLAVFSGLAG